MANPWRRQERHDADRLATYWDDLVARYPARPVPTAGTPAEPAAIVRQLHTQEEADLQRPAFEADLLQALLSRYEAPAVVETGVPIPWPTGQVRPEPSRGQARQPARSRRYAILTLEVAIVVALILASAARIWMTSRDDDPQVVAPPAESIPSVPMYRGNPGRTGEMEGPGISGTPVVMNEFFIGPGGFGHPVLSGHTIYVSNGHEREGVFAVDIFTGDVRWGLTGTDWAGTSPPVISGDTVYLLTFFGAVVALDGETGTERWRVEGLATRLAVELLVADGVLYAVGEDGLVLALDAATGALLWQQQLPGAVVVSSAFADGVVYLGTFKGQVHALNAEDGTELWQADVSLGSSTLDGLAVANGLVYVSANKPVRRTDAGFVLALDARTGEFAWRLDAEPRTGYTFLAVDEESAYITDTPNGVHVMAVEAMTGAPRWTAAVDSTVDGAPALVDNALYLGTLGGVLYAFDTETGGQHWQLDFGGEFGSTPIVAGGRLYIGTIAGTIYVIAGSSDVPAMPAPPGLDQRTRIASSRRSA